MSEIVNMHQAKVLPTRRLVRPEHWRGERDRHRAQRRTARSSWSRSRRPASGGEFKNEGKGTIWISPDFEFTDEEITELFEAPL